MNVTQKQNLLREIIAARDSIEAKKGILPEMEDTQLSQLLLEGLRHAGYAIVPLEPTEVMLKAGAAVCFSPYDGDWNVARRDALDCYQAMVEIGRLLA
jgi:hypothetical protein